MESQTQDFKPCEKVALLDSLGYFMWFWPFWTEFGPILAKIDPDFDLGAVHKLRYAI